MSTTSPSLLPTGNSLSATSESGSTTTLAKGITTDESGNLTGWYDINKNWYNDTYMCWAAVASNMLAWWQNTYATTGSLSDVPVEEEAIFSTFTENWDNQVGHTSFGLQWYLAGGSTNKQYNSFYATNYVGDKALGGYYRSFYSTANITKAVWAKATQDYDAVKLANELATTFSKGGLTGLSAAEHSSSYGFHSGHSFTLWGVTQDANGMLTRIYVTDSDDGTTRLAAYDVNYDSTLGYYSFLFGSGFNVKTLYINQFSSMSAPGKTGFTALTKPKSLSVVQKDGQATFSWAASTQKGVSYELSYRLKNEEEATIITLSENSTTLTLPREGAYEWSVRTVFGNSCATAWVKGAAFTCDITPPELTLNEPTAKKLANNKSRVVFTWKSNEKVSYELTVDGKTYKSTRDTHTLTLADGNHSYCLKATDAAGNTTTVAGADFTTDTLVGLRSAIPAWSNSRTLSWDGDADATYTLMLDNKLAYAGEDNSFTAEGLADGRHSYVITATDIYGNTATSRGSFTLDTMAPTLTLNPVRLQTNKKTGSTTATLGWKAESGCTYSVLINGEAVVTPTSRQGTRTSYAHSFTPGETFTYQIIAYDKAQNATVSEERTLSYDCEAPELSNLSHSMRLDAATGQVISTFSWNGEDASGVTYTLQVDRKTVAVIEAAPGESSLSREFTNLVKPGTHSYTLTAADWLNNKVTLSSKSYSFTTPALTLNAPKLSRAEAGQVNATLSWRGVRNGTCTLVLDGGEAITVTDTSGRGVYSYTPATTLRDGLHLYRVIAENTQAGTWTVAEGTFSHDATTPEFILGALTGSVVAVRNKPSKVKATLNWAGEDGVTYTIMLGKKRIYSGRGTSCTYTFDQASGEGHELTITAKDKAGNVSTVTRNLTVEVSNGNAMLNWLNAGEPATLPAEAEEAALGWQAEDTAGIAISAGNDVFSFELTETRQVIMKLSELTEHATLELQQEGGKGSISLAANAGAGLDHELALSAGTYWLTVKAEDGTTPLSGSCMLDLELEKNGRKQAFSQAMLA